MTPPSTTPPPPLPRFFIDLKIEFVDFEAFNENLVMHVIYILKSDVRYDGENKMKRV